MLLMTADFSMGVLPTDGTVPVVLGETRDATGRLGFSRVYQMGEVGLLGKWKYPTGNCSYFINWAAGEGSGPCPVESGMFSDDVYRAMQARRADNMLSPDLPLDAADVPAYTPLFPVFSAMKVIISVTVSRPDMQNLFPRQEGRVASVFVSVDGMSLTNVFLRQDLPRGSLLYGVQHDHWTGEAGHLIGFNKGRFMDYYNKTYPGMGVFPQALPLNVTMHTMEAGSQVPSTIAWHGRHVFATHQHNYAGLHAAAQAGGETFQAWVSQEGTEYWAVVSQVTRGGLRLYLNLLVPRESVMDAIDASTSAIREKNEADKRRADDQQGQALIVMFSVTAAAVSVLLVLAVVLSRLIVSPLHSLQADMANVAIMNLEAVDLERDPSRLSEVSVMQQSFRLMVRNLMEYRNYMPQSVLVEVDTRDTDTDNGLPPQSSTTDLSVTPSAASLPSKSGSPPDIPVQWCDASQPGDVMKRRHMSLVYFNVCGWHDTIAVLRDTEVMDLQARVISALHISLGTKGVCDIVSGDRLMGTFNAFAPLNSHKRHCLTAALLGKKRVEGLPAVSGTQLCVSAAAASGEARVAHMGCQGLKKVTITSAVVPWVVALERYNRAKGLRITADQWYNESGTPFLLKAVDAVRFAKRSRKPIKVYEVVAETTNNDGEWMYQLHSAHSNSPYSGWNAAMDALFEGNYEAASVHLGKVSRDLDPLYETVESWIRNQTYQPTHIEFH